ncbi:MAG: TonB-dependent receptor, partial [Bacteroidota bacterium]|nr:TonB-dependent receptor [Bacteroidota bacterium]
MKGARHIFFFCLMTLSGHLYAQRDSINLPMDRLTSGDLSKLWETDDSRIISASRSERNVEDLPFTAYVISGKEIRDKNYNTLVDLLKDLPGMKVSQPGSALNGETFLTRGQFGNYYVKILVDNIPIQPSAANGMPIGAQLPLQQAERVEVIYGPAAAVYGADAMGGVINIITRKGEGLKTIYGKAETGTLGITNFNFTLGSKVTVKDEVLDILFYGGFQSRADWGVTQGNQENFAIGDYNVDPGGDFLSSPYYRGNSQYPELSDLGHRSGYLGIRLREDHWQFGIDLMDRRDHSAIGLNPLFVTYHDPNHFTGESITRFYANGTYEWGKFRNTTNLSYLRYNMHSSSEFNTLQHPLQITGPYYRFAASDDLFGENLLSYEVANGLQALVGFSFQYSGNFPLFNYFLDPFDRRSYKPFSMSVSEEYAYLGDLQLTPTRFTNTSALAQFYLDRGKWEAVAGVRYDYNHSDYGAETFRFYSALNPRVGVSYKPGRHHSIRMSGGSAFRPPSSFFLYQTILAGYVSGIPAAIPFRNVDIEAETMWSGEIGYRYDWGQRHSYVNLSVFAQETQNLITKTSVTYSNNLYEYGYFNDEDAKMILMGLEARWMWKPIVGNWNPVSDLSVSYVKGEENLPFGRGKLSEVRMMPNWIVKWFVEFSPIRKTHVLIRNQFFSSWLGRPVVLPDIESFFQNPSYFTTDLQVRYDLGENFQIRLGINNLWNERYGGIGASGGLGLVLDKLVLEDLYYNPQPIRTLTIGV